MLKISFIMTLGFFVCLGLYGAKIVVAGELDTCDSFITKSEIGAWSHECEGVCDEPGEACLEKTQVIPGIPGGVGYWCVCTPDNGATTRVPWTDCASSVIIALGVIKDITCVQNFCPVPCNKLTAEELENYPPDLPVNPCECTPSP